MKFKLDENLGERGRTMLEVDGHDVMSIAEQKMSGAVDETVYDVCKAENRILITLDHDSGHTLRFPPEDVAGIVVLECKGRLSPTAIEARFRELVVVLRSQLIDHELWIVEPGRVRIHQKK